MTDTVKKITLLLFILSLMTLISVGAVNAQENDKTPHEPSVDKLITHLNSLTTLRADFEQYNPDRTKSTGQLYLKRPGRIRFEYDKPDGDLIIADGRFIHFLDSDRQDYMNTLISQTPASVILRNEITLGDNLSVIKTHWTPTMNEKIITVARTDNPGHGSVSLYFQTAPEIQLSGWAVNDALGETTEVILEKTRAGIPLSPDLFRFEPPKSLGPGGDR